MVKEVNYLKEYYKKQEHNLKSLLNNNMKNESNINDIKKQITKLQKEIELKNEELHKELEKAYSEDFIQVDNRIIIKYNGRYEDVLFELVSGLEVDDFEDGDTVYNINTKRGNIDVVVGYNYDLASIVIKKYQYSINKDNSRLSTKLLEERVISFMEDKKACLKIEGQMVEEGFCDYYDCSPLDMIKDNKFINTLYNTEYKGKLNLRSLRECNLKNKSFEIIMKTAPVEIIDSLLMLEVEQALPIHKIIGVSLNTYNTAINNNIVRALYDNRMYINGELNERYNIEKTESQWLDLIEEMEHYEEDLSFYDISYNNYYGASSKGDLLKLLLNSYNDRYSAFKDYYTFGKFTNYVINETINQGYTRVRDFISELGDYLNMCKQDNIKPTLYSSYLRQTHDITSRNHKIIVEKEKEDIFKSRYSDFKDFYNKKYMVIAPKCSNDLKKEGDTLNHCVASYIKRVIDGECLILFLRKEKEESLITLEIRHNTIVQVKGLHNRKPTENEIQALKDFANERKIKINF